MDWDKLWIHMKDRGSFLCWEKQIVGWKQGGVGWGGDKDKRQWEANDGTRNPTGTPNSECGKKVKEQIKQGA